MKIVEPSVELIHATPDPEMVVERFGRIAYQSFNKQRPCPSCLGVTSRSGAPECPVCRGWGTDPATALELVAHLLDLGHMSVFEHVCLGVSIVGDRGYTHEQVRHRVGIAYTQESTRFCGFDGDRFGGQIQVVEPPTLAEHGEVREYRVSRDGEVGTEVLSLSEAEYVWRDAMEHAESSYMRLRELGVAAQIARSTLPTGLKSEIGVTANANEWHHVLTLRLSPKAHPQMIEVMSLVLPHLVAWMPQVFSCFLPRVAVEGGTVARRTRDGRRVPEAMEKIECQCMNGTFQPALPSYVGEKMMRVAVDVGDDGELWQVELESPGWRWPAGDAAK